MALHKTWVARCHIAAWNKDLNTQIELFCHKFRGKAMKQKNFQYLAGTIKNVSAACLINTRRASHFFNKTLCREERIIFESKKLSYSLEMRGSFGKSVKWLKVALKHNRNPVVQKSLLTQMAQVYKNESKTHSALGHNIHQKAKKCLGIKTQPYGDYSKSQIAGMLTRALGEFETAARIRGESCNIWVLLNHDHLAHRGYKRMEKYYELCLKIVELLEDGSFSSVGAGIDSERIAGIKKMKNEAATWAKLYSGLSVRTHSGGICE